jgi:hypothetical protein
MRIVSVSLVLCLAAAGTIFGGCTHAGPYVTNIAYDGEGNLLVTKNTVVFNGFFGTIGNGDKETTVIIPAPHSAQPKQTTGSTPGSYKRPIVQQ